MSRLIMRHVVACRWVMRTRTLCVQYVGIPSATPRTLRNKTRKDTMMRFYMVLAVPLLTYGSENWALNRSGRRRIEAEMRFLRRVSGHTLWDHIRNTTIREELHIYDLNDKISDMKIQWLQHIDRMDPERLTKQVLHYIPTGRRSVGRPTYRWRDSL
ncbi:hypothetical protein C0J52_26011 [Blattella germanica]|nr:hypothetical protein C0J52_26011 [Blattella germanica]